MNKYGAQAMAHWKTHAPQRFQNLDDPTRFFTDLGQEAQGQISELARQIETTPASVLAQTASSEQTYLQDVARRMTALRIAEEVVMQQLAWVSDPSLPLDEARQEWNQTTPNDENLIMWAERMQDAPETATVSVATFHGYCLAQLRRDTPELRVAGPEERAGLLDELFPDRSGRGAQPSAYPHDARMTLLRCFVLLRSR